MTPTHPCPLCEAAQCAAGGGHASWLASLDECHVLLGENQGCRGWCVLVLKEHVEHLDALPGERQARIFAEVARVARAIRRVFPASGAGGGPPRINYECLGNLVPHVHWHVIPRHADDPTPTRAVWGWDPRQLRGRLGAGQRAEMIDRLRRALQQNTPAGGGRS